MDALNARLLGKRRSDESSDAVSFQVVVDVGVSMSSPLEGSGGSSRYELARWLIEAMAMDESDNVVMGLMFFGSDWTRHSLEGYDNVQVVFGFCPCDEAASAIQSVFPGPSSQENSDIFGGLVVALHYLVVDAPSASLVALLITDGAAAIEPDDEAQFLEEVLPGLVAGAETDRPVVLHVILLGEAANPQTLAFLTRVTNGTGGTLVAGATSAAKCLPLLSDIFSSRSKRMRAEVAAPLPRYRPLPTPCGSIESSSRGWDWRHSAVDPVEPQDPHASGKWLLLSFPFGGVEALVAVWRVLQGPFERGMLGPTMKITGAVGRALRPSSVICVYTINHRDAADVMRVLLSLRDELHLRCRLDYKTDDATRSEVKWCKFHSPKMDAGEEVVSVRLNEPLNSRKTESSLVAERIPLPQSQARWGDAGCYPPGEEMQQSGGSVASSFDGHGVIHYACLQPVHKNEGAANIV